MFAMRELILIMISSQYYCPYISYSYNFIIKSVWNVFVWQNQYTQDTVTRRLFSYSYELLSNYIDTWNLMRLNWSKRIFRFCGWTAVISSPAAIFCLIKWFRSILYHSKPIEKRINAGQGCLVPGFHFLGPADTQQCFVTRAQFYNSTSSRSYLPRHTMDLRTCLE